MAFCRGHISAGRILRSGVQCAHGSMDPWEMKQVYNGYISWFRGSHFQSIDQGILAGMAITLLDRSDVAVSSLKYRLPKSRHASQGLEAQKTKGGHQ